MTKRNAISLLFGAFMFFTLASFTPKSFAQNNGYSNVKSLTPDEAIAQCLEQERAESQRPQPRFRYFARSANAAYETIVQLLPNAYKNAQKNISYGALNLAEMFERFKGVRICENYYSKTPIQGDPNRTTDLYLPEQKFGILNFGFHIAGRNSQQRILIHVFLGASGYEDDNYQLTLALQEAEKSNSAEVMAMFPQTKEQLSWKPKHKPISKNVILQNEQIIVAGGGYTGSNGGGDSSSTVIKEALMNYAPGIPEFTRKENMPCAHAWANIHSYKQDILSIKIESNKEVMAKNYLEKIKTTNDPAELIVHRNPQTGVYYVLPLGHHYNGTDVTAKSSQATLSAFVILNDFCARKYGGKR